MNDGTFFESSRLHHAIDPRPYISDQGRCCSASEISDRGDTAARQRDYADFNGLLTNLLGLIGGAGLE